MAPPKKVTRASTQRTQPLDEYSSRFYIDPSLLNTEEFEYAWVETSCMGARTESLEQALNKGYEPVKRSEIEGLTQHADLLSAIRAENHTDEYIRRHDQVLMRCNKNLSETRKKALAKENHRRLMALDWAKTGSTPKFSPTLKAPTFAYDASMSRTHVKAFAEDE